mmetsp:Transcript_2924/g.7696  ORF Transcript_2924/g.7696 Transcript_2924/m.7696 type:complete len:252 (+) Transcript_2924:112-867(+)
MTLKFFFPKTKLLLKQKLKQEESLILILAFALLRFRSGGPDHFAEHGGEAPSARGLRGASVGLLDRLRGFAPAQGLLDLRLELGEGGPLARVGRPAGLHDLGHFGAFHLRRHLGSQAVLGHAHGRLDGREQLVRRLPARHHLPEHDPKAVHVRLRPVGPVLNHLWRHPPVSARLGRHAHLVAGQQPRHAEVADLHRARLRNQDVRRLEVPMHNVLVGQVAHALDNVERQLQGSAGGGLGLGALQDLLEVAL